MVEQTSDGTTTTTGTAATWFLTPFAIGNDADGNGTIDRIALQCSGQFSDTETFFAAVVAAEGESSQYMVGHGLGLCGTRTDDWDPDYTFQLSYNGVTVDTQLNMTCQKQKSKDKQMFDALSTQIDDKDLVKSMTGLKDNLEDGSLTVVDSLLSLQDEVRVDASDLINTMIGDGNGFIDEMDTSGGDYLDALITEITVTRVPEYDAYIAEVTTGITDTVVAMVEKSLDAATIALFEDAGLAALQEVTDQFTTSFSSVTTDMATGFTDIATQGKTDLTTINADLKTTWLDLTGQITDIIDGEKDILNQKNFDKKVVPRINKAVVKLDNSFKKVQKGTSKAALKMVKGTKSILDGEIPTAEAAIKTTIDAAEVTLTALMTGQPQNKINKVIKSVELTEKLAKKAGKKITKDVKAYARKYAGQIVRDFNTEIKAKKTESDTYLTGKETEVVTFFDNLSVYPKLPAEVTDLLTNTYDITATIVRLSDSATASCTMASSRVPADGCQFSTVDEMKFDYLCPMTNVFDFQKSLGVTADCTDQYRPTALYCNGVYASN